MLKLPQRWLNLLILLLFHICFLCQLNESQAQNRPSFEQQQFISNLYQSYYQRNAGVSEINTWMSWFQRGSSAEEIHASFISSEEFFNRMGRDTDRWLTNVFRIVEGRNPTVPEFNYWKQRWAAVGTDRRKFGLEFLKSQGNRRPGSDYGQSGDNLSATASQMAAQSRSLMNSINQEVPGNTTVLRMQANSLITATAQFYSLTIRNNVSQRELLQSFQDVQSAYAGVEAGLFRASGAFNSKLYLNQISQSIQQIASQMNVVNRPTVPSNPGYFPPSNPPSIPGFPGGGYFPPNTQLPGGVFPGSGYPGGQFPSGQYPGGSRRLTATEYMQVNQLAYELSQETRSVFYLLQNLSQTDYRYQGLVTDLQWYSSQIDDFRSQLNQQTERRNLRRSIRTMKQYADGYNQRIQGAQVDIRLTQGFYQINQTLQKMGDVIRVDEAGVIGQLPSIPNRQQWLDEIDRALAQCDRLINVYSQYLLYGRSVQVYLAQLRSLKQSLLNLRSNIVQGIQPYQLRTQANAIVTSISIMDQSWNQVSQSVRMVDSNDMNALRTSASRFNSLVQ